MVACDRHAPGQQLDGFRKDLPDWKFWRGRDEQGAQAGWYATRINDAPVEETVAHGLSRTVGAGSADELRRLVVEQDEARAELGIISLAAGSTS